MGENGLSAADVAAVTNNDRGYGYSYPVMPYPYMGGYGGGFGGGLGNSGDWAWIIILLAVLGGGFNNGFGGGFGGGDNMYPWLANGQKEIMTNTNNGFDTLHLSNQIEGVRDGIYGLSNQLCNCCADMNQTVSTGFANAETSANARQIANMQQAFSNQLSTVQGFNSLGLQLCEDTGENRLATQDLKATIISENCNDREVLREIGQNILVNQNNNTQKIIDEIFRDRLDEKQDKIDALNRELLLKNLEASQIAQTTQTVDAIYNRLDTCPVGTTPVYGRTPIFSCNNNNGCGCGNTFGNTLV